MGFLKQGVTDGMYEGRLLVRKFEPNDAPVRVIYFQTVCITALIFSTTSKT